VYKAGKNESVKKSKERQRIIRIIDELTDHNNTDNEYISPLDRDTYNYGYLELTELDNFESVDAPPKGM